MSVCEILRSLELLKVAKSKYDTQTLPIIRYE